MREKDTFTKRIAYEYNQLDTITEFLEEKALEGWELTSKSGAIWGFKKAEPRRVKFSVELMEEGVSGSELDEFIDFCEADGWKHYFDAGSIQIFENENLEAEPIHTDPAVKLAIVHEKCKAFRVFMPIVCSAIFFVIMWKLMFPLDIYFFKSTRAIGNLLMIPTLCSLLLLEVADYLKWYSGAKRAVEKGDEPVYKKSKFSKASDVFMLVVIFANGIFFNILDTVYNEHWQLFKWLIVLVVISFVGFGVLFPKFSAKYNKTKTSNGAELAAIMAVVFVLLLIMMPHWTGDEERNLEPSLTLETLGICDTVEDDVYIHKEMSPILKYYEYYEEVDDIDFTYDIYITKLKMAYDTAVEHWTVPSKLAYEMYEDVNDVKAIYSYYKVDEPAFGAEKVLYNEYGDRFLLLYSDRVVRLDIGLNLTDAQKKIICEKFLEIG